MLLLTLVALAVLLVGGATLLRAMDSSLLQAGNLGFKRDLVNQAERSTALAINLLSSGALASEATQLASDSHGIPSLLHDAAAYAAAGMGAADLSDSTTGVTLRYLIDRQCAATGDYIATSCVTASDGADTAADNRYRKVNAQTRPVYRSSGRASASSVYEVYIRIKVCDTSVGVETNCMAYPAGNYKPEGLMQQYAMKLRYAAFGYLNDGNVQRDDAALRYFKNLGNVPAYSSLAGAGSASTLATWVDGFPVITHWTDPIVYSCQKNFILGIGDVNTWADANLNGSTIRSNEPSLPTEVSADTSVNVKTATDMVGQLEGISNLGSYSSGRNNSYFIAGLAYDAHTHDIRSDLVDTQTVSTYWVDVLEGQTYLPKNQYWLAAKYGGFEVPAGFSPYAGSNGTGTLPNSAWDNNADTLTNGSTTNPRPDNYFTGGQADKMISGLGQAFAKIAAEAAAATSTALASVSPNEAYSGSANYAASYDPKTWSGTLTGSTISYANVSGVASGVQSAADFLNYLRGDKTNEQSNAGPYRSRSHRLGDIVNAKLTPIGALAFTYYDRHNPGYSAFRRSYKSRKTVVYAGANDGMLHAFDGALSGSSAGSELFAYIPSFTYGRVALLASGYNNADGKGYIFIVNPKTGALLETLATPDGSTAAPINLAHLSAYIPDLSDYRATALYSADLQGNVWRVDLSPTSGSNIAERITVTPSVNNGIVGVAVNLPTGDACSTAGSSYVFAVGYATGKTVLTDNSGTAIATTGSSSGVVSELAFKNVGGRIQLIAGRSSGSISNLPGSFGRDGALRRLNWREVPTMN